MPTSPSEGPNHSLSFCSRMKFTAAGQRAWVADGKAGVQVLDVSNPAAIAPLGAYDTGGFAWDVQVVGRRIYVADGSSGLVPPEFAKLVGDIQLVVPLPTLKECR